MARDYMGELAAKPLNFKLAVLGAVLAALGLLYWQLFYSGLSEDLDAAKNRNRSLRQKSDKLAKDKGEWDRLVLQKKELDTELTKNQVSLPSSAELPSFFYHLQKQAAGAGVKLDQWNRLKETPVESYVKVPVAMEVTGSFHQINNYFKLLYETDRIITVENLELSYLGSKDDEIQLKAKFQASTFRLPDQPPQTDLPDAPAPARAPSPGGQPATPPAGGQPATPPAGDQPATTPAPGAAPAPDGDAAGARPSNPEAAQ